MSNSLFKRGSAVYACRNCKRSTRYTGGDGADVLLCDDCFDLCGLENSIADSGETVKKVAAIRELEQVIVSKGGKIEPYQAKGVLV